MQTFNIKTAVGVTAGIAVIALFFWFGIPGTGNQEGNTQSSGDLAAIRAALDSSVSSEQFVEVAPKLKLAEITVGTGAEVRVGKTVAIHYIGRFEDGTQFDSSVDRGQPLAFVYGQGELIQGFEASLSGARVGSVRRIVVPPELAYGKTGVTSPDGKVIIPPDATLIFDVMVIGVDE